MKKNYIRQGPSYDEYRTKHNQEIQTLPGPTITIINMAVERIIDDPNWEEANPFVIQYDRHYDLLSNQKDNQLLRIKQATDRINDSSLFQKYANYETKPNIYIHQPDIQNNNKYSSNLNKNGINHNLRENFQQISDNNDNNSTTSELSGHDSETIHVFIPKKQSPTLLENEDKYKTADIDEFDVEIKDLIRLQKSNNTYDDILSSNLQNLRSPRSQGETNRIKLRQTEQQPEDDPVLFPLLSSSICYKK